MGEAFLKRRAVRKAQPELGLTEHRLDASHRIVVIVNYAPSRVRETLTPAVSSRLKPTERQGLTVDVGKNDGCVLTVARSA